MDDPFLYLVFCGNTNGSYGFSQAYSEPVKHLRWRVQRKKPLTIFAKRSTLYV